MVTLADAMNDATFRNLSFAAARKESEAGEQRVRAAQALLRPSIDSDLTGLQIDDDRASPLSGQSERSLTAGLEVSQILWSEAATSNVAVQRSLQEGREAAVHAAHLDAIRDAAVAYYNLLRAQTLRSIRREDLALTRSHLELARVRSQLGQAGPAEIYRWQSTLANARREVVRSAAQVRKAQFALNQVRHRPLGEEFRTEAEGLTLEYLLERRGPLLAYTGSRRHFEGTTDFMVQQSMEKVPELRELDGAIRAQERVLLSRRRTFRSPDVTFRLRWDQRLEAAGEGSGSSDPSTFAASTPDDSSWSAAISASLNLFSGGARSAERTEAELTLEQLHIEREAVAERLEQAIRSNLQDTQTAFSGIVLTETPPLPHAAAWSW